MTKEDMKKEVAKMATDMYKFWKKIKEEGTTDNPETIAFKAWSKANVTALTIGAKIDYLDT